MRRGEDDDWTRGEEPPGPVKAQLADIAVEQALLGALLLGGAAFDQVSAFLRPDHFAEQLHGVIFATIGTTAAAGRKVSPLTVKPYLPAVDVGGLTVGEYLASLAADAVAPAMIPDLARIIRDFAVRRGINAIGEELIRAAGEAVTEEPWRLIEEAESSLGKLAAEATTARRTDMAAELSASQADLDDAYTRQVPIGTPWCLPEIETVLDARIEPGQAIGLLAASREGKTALALQEARNQAERGVPVLFLSGEQTIRQCITQLHAQRLGIGARDIKAGLVPIERTGGREAVERAYSLIAADKAALKALPLVIQEWDAATADQLMVRARAFERVHGPCFVVVDNASVIEVADKRANFAEQINAIYRPFKRFALGRGSRVLALMQRNMNSKERGNPAPTRSDIYGGDRALQNLDLCVALYRPDVWLREKLKVAETDRERSALGVELSKVSGLAEFHALKTRFGDDSRTRTVVRFEGEFTRFVSQRQAVDDMPLPML